MLDKNQPIIVKKIKKSGGGHSGGAWKIAYADFVTAMMAFFLLMWLLAVTDEEQKRAISDYFHNPTAVTGGDKGANSAIINMGSAIRLDPGAFGMRQEASPAREQATANSAVPTDSDVEKRMEEIEQKALVDLKEQIEHAIEKNEDLRPYREQMLMEMTNDGLRISVMDKQNRPMFDVGRAHLMWYMSSILREIAKLVNSVPNKISIAGHTDARRYQSDSGYSNWELSADRANASRRQLMSGGMRPDNIVRVVGLASMALHDKDDPNSPANRRITLTVLKKKAEEAISKESEAIHYTEASNFLNLPTIDASMVESPTTPIPAVTPQPPE